MNFDASICFNESFYRLDDEIMSIIPCYDTFYKYYSNYSEKMRIPDLYGKTVRVTSKQFPKLYSIISSVCEGFHMDCPQMFVYEGFYYDIESYGIARPWIEISSASVSDLTAEELTFFISREIFKIKAHITERYMVVEECLRFINSHGSKFFLHDKIKKGLELKYASWSRCAQYSADNFGYYIVQDLALTTRCILLSILNNKFLVDNIAISEYINDCNKIDLLSDKVSVFTKYDERIPYGQYRIKNLIRFAVCNC